MTTKDCGPWRPKYVPRSTDFIEASERSRLEAKWRLFQAQRRGESLADLAQRERDVEYYDVAIPRWKAARAETEAQRVRMLKASDDCLATINAIMDVVLGTVWEDC